MKVKELFPNAYATAEAGNVLLKISTRLLEKVAIGDYVIVHAGFAIEILDEEAAMETIELLNELATSY